MQPLPRNRQGPKANFNVKVGIRIRPFSEKERLKNPANREFVMTNGNNVFVNDKSFNYDHVFTPETDQEEVFKQVGKPQLDSLLEGNGFRIYDKLFTYRDLRVNVLSGEVCVRVLWHVVFF